MIQMFTIVFKKIFGGAPAEPTTVGVVLTMVWAIASYSAVWLVFIVVNQQLSVFLMSQGREVPYYYSMVWFVTDYPYISLVAPVLIVIWVLQGFVKTEALKQRSLKRLYRIKSCLVWLCVVVCVCFTLALVINVLGANRHHRVDM
jgi:hypothetical protein